MLFLLLCMYWRTANQLCAFCHLLYWTVYIRKPAWAWSNITNVKAGWWNRGRGAVVPNVKTPLFECCRWHWLGYFFHFSYISLLLLLIVCLSILLIFSYYCTTFFCHPLLLHFAGRTRIKREGAVETRKTVNQNNKTLFSDSFKVVEYKYTPLDPHTAVYFAMHGTCKSIVSALLLSCHPLCCYCYATIFNVN